jgi:hypothetical protein
VAIAVFRWLSAAALVLLALTPIVAPGSARADDACQAEVEPNDTPDAAADVTGASCLTGTIAVGDQDLFRLHTDAPGLWTLALQGVAGNETRLDLLPLTGDPATPGSRIYTEVAGPGAPPALLLPPGDWLLGLSTAGDQSGAWTLQLKQLPVTPADPLPPLTADAPVVGMLAPSTATNLPLTVPAALARRHLALALDVLPGTALTVALDGPAGRMMERNVTVDGPLVLPDLGLDAGDYALSLTALAAAPLPFRATLTPDRPRLPTREDEPDDTALSARPLLPGKPVTGVLAGQADQDLYAFDVTPALAGHLLTLSALVPKTVDPAALARLTAAGAGFTRKLCLQDATGTELQCRMGPSVTLGDLALPEGHYLAAITGPEQPDLPYELALRPGPALAEGQEREPNDEIPQAQPIAPGQVIAGRFLGLDVDRFALQVTGAPQLWRIEALGGHNLRLEDPRGSQIATRDERDGSGDDLVIDDVLLTEGRHTLRLEGVDGGYTLTATPKGPPPEGQESEPNDTETEANLLHPGQPRRGTLSSAGDRDNLRFHLDRDAALALVVHQTSGPPMTVTLTGPSGSSAQEVAGADLTFPADFKAGDYVMELRTAASDPAGWQISLDWAAPPAPGATGGLGASLVLVPGAVASHLPVAQTVRGKLHLTNAGAATTGSLDLASPVPALTLEEADVMIPAGASDQTVLLDLPPDLMRDPGLPVTLTLTAPGGQTAVAGASVAVTPDAPAASPRVDVPPPVALRGGYDLAAPGFGGVVPDDAAAALDLTDPTTLPLLFNGMADSEAFQVAAGKTLRVDFGPADPVPVAGFALTPRAMLQDYNPSPLADFQMLLSVDGVSFTPVLTATLGARDGETFFVLPKPVPAKAAELRILSGTHGTDDPVLLSEWKVLSAPGQPPGVQINLADPDRGGHVVRVDPQPAMLAKDLDEMLKPGGTSPVISGAGPPALVVGFADTRRAVITALDWIEAPDPALGGQSWGAIAAFAGPTPIGPWTRLGVLTPDADGQAHLDLDAPTPARFVRFAQDKPLAGGPWNFPTELRISEQAATAATPSIVGEWGMGGVLAGADLGQPVPAEADDAADTDSATAPRPLPWDQPVQGRVTLDQDEDWWQFTPLAGTTRAMITLTGQPFVTAALTVLGPDGAALPLRPVPPEPGQRRFEAPVTPGTAYTVHVVEPPRSLVVGFDVSGSLAPFWQAIRAGMAAFAEAPVPGRDFIRFLPFDGQFDDTGWTDQPDLIRRALTDLSDAETGSGLEATVLTATDELEKREGPRALLVLTDGATSSEAQRTKMWAALERAGVDVMAAHIGGWDDPARERRLLQDVAAVGGGFFADVESQAQIDALAERAVDWLRRPARYGLGVATSTLPPPEPAHLSVQGAATVAAADAAASGPDAGAAPQVAAATPAVELIIDASGSMLQQLGAEGRRIDVAHRVLDKLIRQTLPVGTPVALRAFGDTAAGSCDTSLRTPLAPLVPDDMAAVAGAIEPVNLAKTPIAASLAATADDMAGASGPRVVVLVTDGEETCGGDPAAEIARLRAAGVQVTVNIVGFAVDDSAIAATLAGWAQAGGGRYLPAADEQGLGQALTDAVSEGFTVQDGSGKIVAQGQVGGAAVDLAPGTYQVVVGDGRVTFPAVALDDGEARVLNLPQD